MNFSLRSRLALALLAALSAMVEVHAMSSVTSISAEDVACQLEIPSRVSRTQAATLTITLHNRSKHSLRLLKRNTPLEGWLADSLQVERDGQAVPYIGAMAKRMPPTVSEYLTLKANARYRHTIAIQGGYDVSTPGTYQVRWTGNVMDVLSASTKPSVEQMNPLQLQCPAISFVRAP